VSWDCTGVFKQLQPEYQPRNKILTYGMISGHRIKPVNLIPRRTSKMFLLILLNTDLAGWEKENGMECVLLSYELFNEY
jgi:hypothetical protein